MDQLSERMQFFDSRFSE